MHSIRREADGNPWGKSMTKRKLMISLDLFLHERSRFLAENVGAVDSNILC